MKPGRLQLFTLRLAFSVILAFAKNVFRPGFLGSIGTIHFARWVMLPGGQLLFYSNYGGSWESYLEDFITKAHAGLTGVWSNTIGFPRTRVLFQDGATDGDRFKRWARRQQHPTLAWYCAYPHLNTSRIRANAAIRQGLGATTESEARDWLGCFGSTPPTASKLEAGDIQAVLYSGLGRLKYSRALILRLGANSALNRAWLRQLEGDITTAEKVPEKSASIFAVSHSGLDKLGVSERVRASFPARFSMACTPLGAHAYSATSRRTHRTIGVGEEPPTRPPTRCFCSTTKVRSNFSSVSQPSALGRRKAALMYAS